MRNFLCNFQNDENVLSLFSSVNCYFSHLSLFSLYYNFVTVKTFHSLLVTYKSTHLLIIHDVLKINFSNLKFWSRLVFKFCFNFIFFPIHVHYFERFIFITGTFNASFNFSYFLLDTIFHCIWNIMFWRISGWFISPLVSAN